MSVLPGSPPQDSPQAMELFGMLSRHLIHELTNHLTCIVGNAQAAQWKQDDPTILKASLNAISQAGNNAGELLGRFRDLRSTYSDEQPLAPLDSLGEIFSTEVSAFPGWSFEPLPASSQQIRVDPRWMRFLVRELVEECGTAAGALHATLVERNPFLPGMPRSQPLLCLSFVPNGDAQTAPATAPSLRSMAAEEFVRSLAGWIERPQPGSGSLGLRVSLPTYPNPSPAP